MSDFVLDINRLRGVKADLWNQGRELKGTCCSTMLSNTVYNFFVPMMDLSTTAIRKARRYALKARTAAHCAACLAYGNRCSNYRPCARCTKLSRECVPLERCPGVRCDTVQRQPPFHDKLSNKAASSRCRQQQTMSPSQESESFMPEAKNIYNNIRDSVFLFSRWHEAAGRSCCEFSDFYQAQVASCHGDAADSNVVGWSSASNAHRICVDQLVHGDRQSKLG